MWGVVMQVNSPAMELLHRLVDTVSGIIRQNRVHRDEQVALRAEADRFPLTPSAMAETSRRHGS
jgi:hypothetical protein